MPGNQLFSAAGDLQGAYESVDWCSTPLGRAGSWTPTLAAVFETMARTRFPCTLLWGPDAVLLYNNEYVPILGEKHPAALGRRAEDVFPEAWDFISGLLTQVRSTGQAVFLRDAPVPLYRDGRVAESFFTFCYSAVVGPGGEIEGVLDIVTETTREVLVARRLSLVDDLRRAVAETEDAVVVRDLALQVLSSSDDVTAAAFLTERVAADPLRPTGTVRDVELRLRPDGSSVARLPLETADGTSDHESLELTLNPAAEIDDDLVTVLRTIGATVSQAISRRAHLAVERDIARVERGFSEALQLSLLGEPQAIEGLEVAVRYLPASDTASVGGDWYDAFVVPGGALLLAIGDIAGHDRNAAIAMAQARNILRGIAFSGETTPARILGALDRAVSGLHVADASTGIVATLDPADDDGPAGTRTLRWSNAGHPPPAMVTRDGTVSLLERSPEPLLGLDFPGTRHDHSVVLGGATTVVLYTDGLVERRGEHLDSGLARLRDALAGSQLRHPDRIIEELVGMAGSSLEDDVAIMVLRFGENT